MERKGKNRNVEGRKGSWRRERAGTGREDCRKFSWSIVGKQFKLERHMKGKGVVNRIGKEKREWKGRSRNESGCEKDERLRENDNSKVKPEFLILER
jgi:hypothetical protein